MKKCKKGRNNRLVDKLNPIYSNRETDRQTRQDEYVRPKRKGEKNDCGNT